MEVEQQARVRRHAPGATAVAVWRGQVRHAATVWRFVHDGDRVSTNVGRSIVVYKPLFWLMMTRIQIPSARHWNDMAQPLMYVVCPVVVSQCGNAVRCENRVLICHSSPDVKGSFLPQPEGPFNSPIRSRPCPGRLFYALRWLQLITRTGAAAGKPAG